MTAAELLADCHARNIDLQARGEQLDVDAPAGELTPDLLARLREHKPELLALLAGGAEPVTKAPNLVAIPAGDVARVGDRSDLQSRPLPNGESLGSGNVQERAVDGPVWQVPVVGGQSNVDAILEQQGHLRVPDLVGVATRQTQHERFKRPAVQHVAYDLRVHVASIDRDGDPRQVCVQSQDHDAADWIERETADGWELVRADVADDAMQDLQPCPVCGGLERWQDLAGGWHCEACSPRVASPRLLDLAPRLRERHGATIPSRQPRPAAVPKMCPPAVPAGILAAPRVLCRDCGKMLVVPSQPGKPQGLCFGCWSNGKAGVA